MNNFKTRSEFEARTHELFELVGQDYDDSNWQNLRIVRSVFKAMWSSSMHAEKIEKVGCAMFGFESLDLTSALDALVKEKVLRSRRSGKVKLYEVNY